MEQIKLPPDFSDNVMAAIRQEVARRERRDEWLMYACIATVGILGLGTIGYLLYRYEWFARLESWFRMDIRISLNPIWLPVLISSLVLVFFFCYLTIRKEKEATLHG